MAKDNSLIIKDFQQGIGPSPHVGFGDMRNLDIFTRPGVARLTYSASKVSSTTVTDLIKWFYRNPNSIGDVWAIGDTNRVYKATSNGSSYSLVTGNNSGSGQGGIIWKDYLFVTRGSTIDVYGPLSSSPSWTTSWKSIDNDVDFHPMIIGQDDIVYGGAGRYVFTIQEVAGQTFAPGNSATYTFTQKAVTLPAAYRIKCLAELGYNLMIGTWMGTNLYDFRIADIFPWDRSTTNTQPLGLPIRMNEFGVNAMINVGNMLYILAGIEGKIYISSGTQAQIYARVPRGIFTANMDAGTGLYPYPGAIMTLNDRIYFGLGSTGALGGSGIWSVSLVGATPALNFENTISTGNDGSSNALQIGALCPIAMTTYLIGWNDNTTYGVDQVGNSNLVTSYAGYFESPLYQVGTVNNKRSFNTIEFQLAKPLASGHGIRLKYRKNLSDAYTTIGTWDFSTNAGLSSISSQTNIADAEFIQIRGEITTGSSSATTPELRYIRLS